MSRDLPGPGHRVEVNVRPGELNAGHSRISVDIDGSEVFFESADIELRSAPEVWASAFLPATVQYGWVLCMDEPLDATWLSGLRRNLALWANWWGTADQLGDVIEAPRSKPLDRLRPAGPANGRGLCFTGGVDSFHTLFHSGREFDALVFVHGFDIRLKDGRRFAAAERSVRAIAHQAGLRAIVVRTNLRDTHPVGGAGWGRTHGGALAALGHACSRVIGDLTVASTTTPVSYQAWGSTPASDANFSSRRLRISHFGQETEREDKIAIVIRDQGVREHLRVCWEGAADQGNCGECEKCVRTMLGILVCGEPLDGWPFAGVGTVAERIDRVDWVHPEQVANWRAMAARSGRQELVEAVERLARKADDPFDRRAVRRRRAKRRAAGR